ncbi:MAG: uracil-DNA glycosylase [Nitrosotalea sp.]
MRKNNLLDTLNYKIVSCEKCPRLVLYRNKIAKEKVKRFKDQIYWGKPLTGFGDSNAQLLIVGLAPAAHGGNRTGRMFTGDSSGDWLAKVLYDFGFANKPTSTTVDDGLELNNAYITAALRCVPPENKPAKNELTNCSDYLKLEFEILKNVNVIICLGKIAFDSCCKLLGIKGIKFSHAKFFSHNEFKILCSYHPSRQNTQTGKLKWNQWAKVFSKAKRILDEDK